MHQFVIINISNITVNSRNSESQCTTAYNTVTSLVLSRLDRHFII